MRASDEFKEGRKELRQALGASKRLFWGVFLFSFFVNILMLTGPMFMLQVYDRVLSSRAVPTLVTLFALVAVLFAIMGVLDYLRARVLARAGARFQALLDRRVFEAVLRRSVSPAERARPATAMADLEAIQRLLSGPAPFALFDAPWAPFFLFAIFMFHWMLGIVAIVGGVILFTLALLNEAFSKKPMATAAEKAARSEGFSQALRRDGETVQGLGMRDDALTRWGGMRDEALQAQIQASDRSGAFATASKTLRFFLQSAMLGMGAYLAILQEVTPGVMIAASILMGRALAPIEQAIAQWAGYQRAFRGWKTLAEVLQKTPSPQQKTALPAPAARLDCNNVTVAAPGEQVPALRGVTFNSGPGEAIGVIGPSASGKSTLARVLAGVWQPAGGKVRLDGAALDQWDDAELGRHLGYLPQDVALFAGSIADNIARMSNQPDAEAVIAAAKLAGAHEMILGLAQGYDTLVGQGGGSLSGGQRQRVALARALYGSPVVVVLDEPNSNLDAVGERALTVCIEHLKEQGRIVIVMAHRPSAISACDKLLMLEGGTVRAFGPKEEVLKKTVRNYPQVVAGGGAGGGASA